LFGWLKQRASMWGLDSLADFARATAWMEKQRRRGRQYQALGKCFRSGMDIFRRNIPHYVEVAERLDTHCNGIFARPIKPIGRGVTLPEGMTVLDHIRQVSRDLMEYMNNFAENQTELINQWQRVLSSKTEYVSVLKALVGDLGQFEVILPLLPGTGEMITDPQVQQCLEEMYEINTQNLRMMELMHDTVLGWASSPNKPCWAFFERDTNMTQKVMAMLLEYMLHADPVRIQARKEAARAKGRSYQPYRFWRAAENLRLMADVGYVDGPKRMPVARRRYVQTNLEPCSGITCDVKRMEWALKEVFNNALSASSITYVKPTGQVYAEPLEKHNRPDPDPAIHIRLREITAARGHGQRDFIELSIIDEGRGIEKDHLPFVKLWGYSPRREEFRQKANRNQISTEQARMEIQIGGKGIGLAYADDVFREHGGRMDIESTDHGGTRIAVLLPVPTPLPLR
jgi:hypothetical protein